MVKQPLDASRPHRVVLVGSFGTGRRVDAYLALRFSDWSRAQFVRWIRAGLIRSDSRALKASSTLSDGETIRIFVPGIAPDGAPPPLPDVLFEDEHLMALDKPAGLLMHAVGQRWSYSVVGLARDARPGHEVDIAHRLDRETSGVVILVKTLEANRRMRELFSDRYVSKTYQAIVHGVPDWEEAVCDRPLGTLNPKSETIQLSGPTETVELRQGFVAGGALARTGFRVLARLPGVGMTGVALLECSPETGRTHQIRAHLEDLGFPILGDKLYGQPDSIFLEALRKGATRRVREAIGFPRHCLHARSIAFPHPFTGQTLRVTAPLPEDMQGICDGVPPEWLAEN
ncbi:MAG: RluA family pseudouridine synthase [Myxococcales bacterium]|nr:RluA family pseudouridine synthase [Myxococcales bacterium]